MLFKEGYMNAVHVIQISTCHRSASICFDTKEDLLQFTKAEHSLQETRNTFYPDYYERKIISIENLPTELPDKEVKSFLSQYLTLTGKTYYPGIKCQNKFITTGTRIYQYNNILQHIPRHIYYFCRYFQIRYNEQPEHIQTEQDLPAPVTYLNKMLLQPQTKNKTHRIEQTKNYQTNNNQQMSKIL